MEVKPNPPTSTILLSLPLQWTTECGRFIQEKEISNENPQIFLNLDPEITLFSTIDKLEWI